MQKVVSSLTYAICDRKLQLLKEEIEPKLEKLRTEKRLYLEFQKVECEIERITRVVIAYKYRENEVCPIV
jgi:chromosome segregation ATPase